MGEAWLEENPSFIELADQLCQERAPEIILRNHSARIGSGLNSEVRRLGEAAIKISSPTTGKKAGMLGSWKPENLIDQFHFLSALGRYLRSSTDESISTPDQYLAFHTPHGNFIRVEQHMNTWTSLLAHATAHGLSGFQERAINRVVEGRVKSAVRDPLFRLGLNDLGLERREPLHSTNILVPSELEDLDGAPLCIIDQPGPYRAYLGKLSIALTISHGSAKELVNG